MGIQYISNINQPSLDIAIKERSITHYLHHRSKEIIDRTTNIVEQQNQDNNKKYEGIINDKVLKQQKKSFKKLINRLERYFLMQLDYQHKVSTINSLTQHLPLYYRMKLLHTLFQRFFKRYPFLYNNKNLYFRLLDNVQEQIYTYWQDHTFEFIVDPQQSKILDFMIIQFGQCEVYSRKEWINYIKTNKTFKPKYKSAGDLIGFRSLILQNSANNDERIKRKMAKKERPKYVIRPVPCEKNEKFKMVSILKINEIKWNQIINDALSDYDEKIKFEKWVEDNIKHDVD